MLGLIGLCWTASTVAETPTVRVVPFERVATTALYSAPATVVAKNAPRLAAEIDARIIGIPVETGDRVTTGELLATLDCRRNESILAAAIAERDRTAAQQEFAAAQLARARDLKRNRNISEETLDQRRTDLATARAQHAISDERLRQAQIDVEHCELRAPFDAVVTAREASVGDYVSRGINVIALIQTDDQEVSVALRNAQTDSLSGTAELHFDHDGRRYPVTLRTLLPNADPTTRTREARLTFNGRAAPPGSAGRLVWTGTQRLLPADFLVRREGMLGVFVLDSDSARFRHLPDAQDGRPAAVDLAPETLLISAGRQRVSDGDKVRRRDDSE